jgi:hypothetical protein
MEVNIWVLNGDRFREFRALDFSNMIAHVNANVNIFASFSNDDGEVI